MADDGGARLPRGTERQFGRESRRGALQRDPTVWYEMRDSAPSQRTPRETGTTVGSAVDGALALCRQPIAPTVKKTTAGGSTLSDVAQAAASQSRYT